MNKSLTRGWRQSMRTEAWYRRRSGWVGIVTVDAGGYRIILNRVVTNFEDALADANALLERRDI